MTTTPVEQLVYQRPEALSDVHTHYCPGCLHGVAHRLIAEVIDELGIRENTIGVAPVGCSVFCYNYFEVDFVEAAHGRAPAMATGVKRVLQTGMIDPKRVGAVGHSWGGFDAAFLAANTQGVFAAAVAGAPLTDLVSMYGDHHWGPGIAETDHIETGQERMVVPLWEDLKAYLDNSAILTVNKMTVPLLLEEGDADGTVFWHQSVEMYNVARRAGKNVVFLVYNGEDHGLRQRKNQVDYQRRILAWFGHYLKGEPAERWIREGQTFLDRDAEVKRAAVRRGVEASALRERVRDRRREPGPVRRELRAKDRYIDHHRGPAELPGRAIVSRSVPARPIPRGVVSPGIPGAALRSPRGAG